MIKEPTEELKTQVFTQGCSVGTAKAEWVLRLSQDPEDEQNWQILHTDITLDQATRLAEAKNDLERDAIRGEIVGYSTRMVATVEDLKADVEYRRENLEKVCTSGVV